MIDGTGRLLRRSARIVSAWLMVLAFVCGSGAAFAQRTAVPRAAPAWTKPSALKLAQEAIDAKRAGNMQRCVEKAQASLAIEEHPYVRLHLSSCLAGTGRVVDALKSAQEALSAAIKSDDAELKASARARVTELLPKLAHIKLKLPKNTEGVKITFDGVPIRKHLLKQNIAVDPGDHVLVAEKLEKGDQLLYRESFSLAEGEDRVVEVLLKPSNLPPGEKECLEQSTTYEEKLACIEKKSTRPNVHVGLEMSGYTDSTNVHVVTPAVNGAIVSPTGGWNLGASYLLDVVTAASPDIVSMASRRFRESRHAGTLSGGYKISTVALQANGNLSHEPDYLSTTGGLAASTELSDKLITPRIGYAYTYDRIGIRNTPFSQYERNLITHELEGGITFVLSPTTLLVTGVTVRIERGEQSKLYRFVPVFTPEIADQIQPGESVESVNAQRLNPRPRELVPQERDRFAIGARINHRFARATLRIEERIYTDNWGVKASSTDARYLYDLGERLRVWPHLRFHAQTGASFYRLAYAALLDDEGQPLVTYRYRTGDRELAPMYTVTIGGGGRIALTGEKAETQYAIVIAGEMMYSQFLKSLFVTNRTAVYGSVGFEAEF
jgi:hypothetical protein